MQKTKLIFFLAILIVLLTASLVSAAAQTDPPQTEDLALAERFAPVLYFHPEEVFRPQPVDVLVENARLRQNIRWWFDANILNRVTLSDLLTHYDADYFLDVWYGSRGLSDYKNYSAHRDYYINHLSPSAGGPPMTAYARVLRGLEGQHIVIQYWLFYYYNDWFNKHEGDWEFVQVILDRAEKPRWVVLSQHHGGTRRAWEETQIENETHPAVYVASGSHANYFWGDEIYPNGIDIGSSNVKILDRTGSAGGLIPEIRLIPEREQVVTGLAEFPLLEWLVFTGSWGERAIQGDFGGPIGPADKGEQWEQPYEFGLDQPLDSQIWYGNRLRVEVTGAGADSARVSLLGGRQILVNAEQGSNPAILHQDPPEVAEITARVEGLPAGETEITVISPIPETSAAQYIFQLAVSAPERPIEISIPASGQPVARTAEGETILPVSTVIVPAIWNAPDLVWFAGYLPAGQVLLGVVLSLAAGILPSLAYAAVLYWNDRYEREPIRLVSAALLWGALPAVAVALVARLFFQLPPSLLGPMAVEALQAGVMTPLIEEGLKGIVVLVIAFRFRREFDNLLDGVIYGAMVGFGYAMTGNTISYLGAFLLRGFDGLGTTLVIEGLLFGLNHAMYTAIFGAGLGYARLAERKSVRILVPVGAFFLAVAANASHSLVVNNLLGVNLLTLAVNWLGIGLVIVVSVWSLRHQRQVLIDELGDEISASELEKLIHPRLKRESLKAARRSGGRKAANRLQQRYQLLAEYAFKKDQHRRFPQDGLGAELEALRKEVKSTFRE